MRSRRRAVAPCVPLLFAWLLACAPPPRPSPADAEARALEVEVLRLVNAHRGARKLPRLREEPLLAELARGHSATMARHRENIGHDGFRRRFQHASATLPLSRFAENVAKMRVERSRPASWAVKSWLGSQVHLKNIEGPFRLTGVGVVRASNGDLYFTQLFAEAMGR